MAVNDGFGRHEVLHMAAFLARTVASELAEHPEVKANPEWLALADQAGQSLEALYQAVGAAHLDQDRA
ncbi:hypothetical protein [Pelagibacterium luteolum]|uniref:Uncharacterized protein n=1 Tax=Pelagibacterium luteolum TaxID=440168 RepID=A0A1G7YN34_9HYPH|nr:hypothetical protein [Pelagibacterium luteolum]SDG97250.1 hypothetical protein SAMN04487974_11479 [Pelagibacterium luteolum]